jgi:hypothetical protein
MRADEATHVLYHSQYRQSNLSAKCDFFSHIR